MITYEEIKIWITEKENKKILLLVLCGIVLFLAGYGAGSYVKPNRQSSKTYSNYTTVGAKKPAVDTKTNREADDIKTPASDKSSTTTKPTTIGCIIKGNISAGGKKIYHIPGGQFYQRVKAEICFSTAGEAEAAGFVKSGR